VLFRSTSFVGRERELVDTKRLLSRCRLLTLVGIGGIGKTRLALQAAAEVVDAYRDGVWFVDLAPLADAALVPSAVAQVLAVRETAGTPLVETLRGYMRGRQLLLLLDNCEHLLAGCATLADALLRGAPELSIIATSREPLRVAGEQTYPLATLSLPDPAASAETIGRSEAVQLLLDRAEKQQPDFAQTDARAGAIAQLCIHLDGIPLALELAAARIRTLSIDEINARLNDRFNLLTGGNRTARPRQQTLRATLDWSFDLLRASEKALLCRASVFAGGWTLAAAEKVCAGVGIDDAAVLDLVASLADKSLVTTDHRKGGARYRLLETVRQYAEDRLREMGDERRWRDRHLAHFLAVVELAEPRLTGADQQEWLDRLEDEHDNLRSALAWSSTAGGDVGAGLRLAGAFWRYWYSRGHLSEGRGWLAALLAAMPSGQEMAVRAKAQSGSGNLAFQQGDYPAARAFHGESLAIRRELGDRLGTAASLGNLGNVALLQGDLTSARALYEEGLTIRRELDDRRGIGALLGNLANVAYLQGDYPAAKVLYEDSLTIERSLGDRNGIAISLTNLGLLAGEQGDYQAARTLHEESLAIKREMGNRQGVAVSLNNLGTVAGERGDYPAARALHQEGLAISRNLGARNGIAHALEGLADVAFGLALLDRAARIWGAAEKLREDIGAPLTLQKRPRHDRQVAAARTAIGDDAAFDSAWREGRAMTLEQVVQYALEEKDV